MHWACYWGHPLLIQSSLVASFPPTNQPTLATLYLLEAKAELQKLHESHRRHTGQISETALHCFPEQLLINGLYTIQ